MAIDRGERDEREKRHDDEHVVDGRRQRRQEVHAVRVEHSRDDAAYAVEHDLEREDAEKRHRQRNDLVELAHRERLRGNELRGEDARQDGEQTQHDDGEVQQVVGERVATRIALLLLFEKVYRDERRPEKTACHQVEHDVGHVVGHLIGAGDQRVAQSERHRPGANEARDARQQGRGGHERRRLRDRFVRLLVDCGVALPRWRLLLGLRFGFRELTSSILSR